MDKHEKIFAEGHLCNVNTSDVFSEILCSLRYCDDYLSDVLYGIERIRTLINECTSGIVWFGFRKNGVDFGDFILETLKDTNRRCYYYRDLIRVEVSVIKRTGTIKIALEHSDHETFLAEYGVKS